MIQTPSLYFQKRIVPGPEIFDFDRGLAAVRSRVAELLERQNSVVFAINGAGPGVGKSRLAGEVAKSFLSDRVPVGVCSDPESLDTALQQREFYEKFFDCHDKGIFVLEGMEPPHGRKRFGNFDLRDIYDQTLERGAKKFGADLNKIDVWAALYTDAVPFSPVTSWWFEDYDPFEDFVIRNEHATPRKVPVL